MAPGRIAVGEAVRSLHQPTSRVLTAGSLHRAGTNNQSLGLKNGTAGAPVLRGKGAFGSLPGWSQRPGGWVPGPAAVGAPPKAL